MWDDQGWEDQMRGNQEWDDAAPPPPRCGDGVVNNDDEECDDGNEYWTDGCTPECVVRICGNHVREGSEQCDDGNLDPGDGCEPSCRLVPWASVHTGRSHTCALDANGRATCWGAGSEPGHQEYGQAIPPDEVFNALSLGADTSCGHRPDGSIACWGQAENGELDVPSGSFTVLAVGGWHGCGLRTDGSIACWGGADGGVPSPVTSPPTGTGFVDLEGGGWHECALREGGEVSCWGPSASPAIPVPTSIPLLSSVSAGASHTCGIRDDDRSIVCWGENDEGQANPPSGAYALVAAGAGHTCALDLEGIPFCWGSTSWGLPGSPIETYETLATGWSHTCGLTTEGLIRCWGASRDNQLAVP